MSITPGTAVTAPTGVFYADRPASGTVIGTRKVKERNTDLTLVGVRVDGQIAWVPLASVTADPEAVALAAETAAEKAAWAKFAAEGRA